ncbi:MAG: Holliday junction resolvase RuvX [Micavibrio sp.]
MPIGLLKDIADRAPENTRLMGLDIGTKTIGLAVSDAGQGVATPLRTIQRRKFRDDLKDLLKIAQDYEIGGYVLGWPLNMDGTLSASCDRVRSFADELAKYPQDQGMKQGSDLWIALFDERLSTDAVHNFLIKDVDMSRTKRAQVVDKLAAQLILQGALDFLRLAR